MKPRFANIFLALIVVLIYGCSLTPPKCSDEETFSLIRQIIIDQLGGPGDASEKEINDSIRIEYPRASAFDEKIKKYSCEARLIAGESVQLAISYESQLDDKNQHLVYLGGIARGDLIQLHRAISTWIQNKREK